MKSKCGRNLVPLGDKLVVKRESAEEVTKGGIIIPDTAQEKSRFGKVLAVGEGAVMDDGTRKQMQVKEGDTVLFSSYSGNAVEIDGEELLLLAEGECLAVVTNS